MVEKNYSFLTETISNLGFGNIFDEPLRNAMKLGIQVVELKANAKRKIGDYGFNVVVEKGKAITPSQNQDDFYFANRIHVQFKEHGINEEKSHTFGLYKQKGFTVAQMESLMRGRFVHNTFRNTDTNEMVGRWQYIDFKITKEDGTHPLKSIYDNKIEFNVVKEIGNLPGLSATQEEKESMARRMKDGSDIAASIRVNGVKENVLLRANPRIAEIEAYNLQGVKIPLKQNNMQLSESTLALAQDNNMGKAVKLLIDGETGKKNQGKKNTPAGKKTPSKGK
ncbi:hypothetical protein CLV51_11048 [Chitinophaga niastensis]|uniref:Uncharacterized protein n=1 Tax=Chitinophaga niastensis TaxID=536980 RepID=A0A2P8H9C9_CHINA|nr:hypothetical protein [Chitinophaga niastensis]PSL42832.1 hypothetical protein CLV51_11048 [Chitinophaga niastensis]